MSERSHLRDFMWAFVAAAGVGSGVVASAFLKQSQPVSYLVVPLASVMVISFAVAGVVSRSGPWAVPTATALAIWLYLPDHGISYLASGVMVILIVIRLVRDTPIDIDKAVVVGAVVFMLAGLFPIVPRLFDGTTSRSATDPGDPAYVILMDGYPRVDTLMGLGVDVSSFVSDLEERGFIHQPDAMAPGTNTHQMLSLMLSHSGDGDGSDARSTWRLPDGWVTIAPPVGAVTIPGAVTLNPGGFDDLQAELIRQSILGRVAGGYVIGELRHELERSLDVLASTDEANVFAHLLAPHLPFLHPGAEPPECWPACSIFEIKLGSLDMTEEEWAAQMGAYLDWLNPQILAAVDSITAKSPDAPIVVMSDHGGRFGRDETEWHRAFLATRNTDVVDLGALFERLGP